MMRIKHWLAGRRRGMAVSKLGSTPQWWLFMGLAVWLALQGAACSSPVRDTAPGPDGRLRVVATTTLVGDVVSQVGGTAIELVILLPPGADPHGFEPVPADGAKVAGADLIFVNGLGLDSYLERLLAGIGSEASVVEVSEGVETLDLNGVHEGEEDQADPHVWTSPANVRVWTQNIARTLGEMDPANSATYAANAAAYDRALVELEGWIDTQVAQIPEESRLIVTDHAVFGYFASRYGFTQVGTVVPGYSSMAEPSAQELVILEDAIGRLGVRAIFVGQSVNPALSQRVADDTGTQLVYLYTGSLGEPGGEAGNYLDYMRYNTTAIVAALR